MTQEPTTWDILRRLLVASWESEGIDWREPMPWSDLVDLARSQGVGSLLRAAIQGSDRAVPAQIQEELDQLYFATARDNALRFQELSEILAVFREAGIAVLLLKGAALAENVYDNVALRPMGDLDLLIAFQDVPRCGAILTARNYAATEAEVAPGTQLAYRGQQAFACHEPFPFIIELHWHPLDIPYYLAKIPADWFWANSESQRLDRNPVQVLNPEANVLYLAAHLALHHRFQGFRWFVDLAWLVHRYQANLDWEQIIAAAQRFELLLALGGILERLADYWPSLPLDGPRQQIRCLQPTPFEQRLFCLLTVEPRGPLLDFYADILCLPDLSSRLQFILFNVFPQPAYMTRRYGVERGWQLPYWYLYRLGDGLVKTARTLPQALRLGPRT
jgi:hypothetical protein